MGIKITGVSSPVGGISWTYSESEEEKFRKLLCYLESKRLIVNPIEMELPDQCIQSAVEIKQFIVKMLCDFQFSREGEFLLKELCAACNDFLNGIDPRKLPQIIYKNDKGDWIDANFSSSMKTFRRKFRSNIKMMEEKYKLSFEKCIPEEY